MGVKLATVDPHEGRLGVVPKRLTAKTPKRPAAGQQEKGRGAIAARPLAETGHEATAPPATSNQTQTLSGVEQFTHPCGHGNVNSPNSSQSKAGSFNSGISTTT